MRRGRLRHEFLMAWVYAAVMAASALPTPLYTEYRRRLGLHAFDITVLYGFYATVVLMTLICAGSMSDRFGRQPVLCLSVASAAISEEVLVFARSLPGLYVSRCLVAIAVGLAIAVFPAYLADLAGDRNPHRATMLGIVANMGGQAFGTVLTGLIATVVADPLAMPYLVGMILLLPVVLSAPTKLPETVLGKAVVTGPERRADAHTRRRRPGEYRATATSIVAAFAMFGFLTAMTGQILEQRMHAPSAILAGALTGLLFIAGAAGQMIARRVAFPRNPAVTVIPLPIAGLTLCAAVITGSLIAFTAAVVVCGIGGGLCLRAGSTRLLVTSPISVRARMSSRIFAALYLGAALPTMAAGFLITTVNIVVSTGVLGLAVIVLATTAAAQLRRLPTVDQALATVAASVREGDLSEAPTLEFPTPFIDAARGIAPSFAGYDPALGRNR